MYLPRACMKRKKIQAERMHLTNEPRVCECFPAAEVDHASAVCVRACVSIETSQKGESELVQAVATSEKKKKNDTTEAGIRSSLYPVSDDPVHTTMPAAGPSHQPRTPSSKTPASNEWNPITSLSLSLILHTYHILLIFSSIPTRTPPHRCICTPAAPTVPAAPTCHTAPAQPTAVAKHPITHCTVATVCAQHHNPCRLQTEYHKIRRKSLEWLQDVGSS
jgi:hypothetical protein